MNYIVWRGQDSREIKGLLICELPPITKPQMRISETVIDGVDGSIIEELGYESYDKALTIGLTQNADIDEISAYFTGDGEVVFSNEADRYYKARIVGRIDYARLLRFRTATIVFRVQPFKYDYIEEERTVTIENRENIIIENNGNHMSKPVITLIGEGSIDISVNGDKIFNYTFPDGENTVVIDSQKQDAYLETDLKNRNMIGNFPTFKVGSNVITWNGALNTVKIKEYSRWL